MKRLSSTFLLRLDGYAALALIELDDLTVVVGELPKHIVVLPILAAGVAEFRIRSFGSALGLIGLNAHAKALAIGELDR